MPGDKKHHTEKFRRCVEQVEAKGGDANAYAVCTASMQKAGEPIFEGAESRSAEEMRLLREVDRVGVYQLHLCGATSAARTEMLNGREHLVVPVVALMEGVIHPVNADVPEYVPWSTIEKMAESFNGKPVVLNHPVRGGRQCSADSPDIIESHGIGVIRNSRAAKESRKLLQEAWLDKVKTKQLHPEMFQRLLDEKMEEVSVGAFVVTDDKAGEFNGRPYKAQWLGGSGDHLAFLPNKRGACSVAMGCGAHRAAMLVTAEGFVEVPDVVPVLAFTALEEQSLDERMQAVQMAINERWNKEQMNGYPTMSAYAVQTFDDRVIVRVKDEAFAVDYEMKDGKAVLGEARRVKQAWVAAARKGKYEDCPACKGTGSKNGNPCEACDGEGEVRHAAMAALLGACACTKELKGLHAHAMKALGAQPGHPFYGNQHTLTPVEPDPEATAAREKVKNFYVVEDHIRSEGGHFVLFGSDDKLRLGQYKTRAEAEEHGARIQQVLAAAGR